MAAVKSQVPANYLLPSARHCANIIAKHVMVRREKGAAEGLCWRGQMLGYCKDTGHFDEIGV